MAIFFRIFLRISKDIPFQKSRPTFKRPTNRKNLTIFQGLAPHSGLRLSKIIHSCSSIFENNIKISLEDIFFKKNLPTAAALSLPRTDFLPSAPA